MTIRPFKSFLPLLLLGSSSCLFAEQTNQDWNAFLTELDQSLLAESVTEGNVMLLSPESAATQAMTNDALVQAAQSSYKSEEAGSKLALSPYLPQVSTYATYGNKKKVTTAQGRVIDSEAAWGVQADQYLFAFGAHRSSNRAAQAALAGSGVELEQAKQNVGLRAKVAVTSIYFSKAKMGVAKKRVELRQQETQDAKALYESGKTTLSDFRQSEINLANAMRLYADEVQSYRTGLHELEAATSLLQFSVPGELGGVDEFSALLEQAKNAIEKRLNVRAIDLSLKQLENTKELAFRNTLPRLSAHAETGEAGEDFGDTTDAWKMSLNLGWNIFSGDERRLTQKKLDHSIEALKQSRKAVVKENRRVVADAETEIAVLKREVLLQKRIVELSEKNYEDMRALYKSGRVIFTRVDESNLNLTEARLNLTSLLFRQEILAHQLERLSH